MPTIDNQHDKNTPAPAETLSREQLEALRGHTPGPWYGEDSPEFWQLFAQRVLPWPSGVQGAQIRMMHSLQLLKAPKGGTPYAEYWPGEADARLIAAAPDLLTTALAALARAEEAEAEVKRLRDQAEAVRLVGLKWSQQAAYLQLAHSRQEGDAVVWGSNLDRMQWQMFGHCADELRAALAGSPS